MKNNTGDVSLQDVVRASGSSVTVRVYVTTRSSRCCFAGIHDSSLKVKLTKPPVEGKANDQCCAFIARALGVAKTSVRIKSGSASRQKVLEIDGLSRTDAEERISSALG